MPEETILTTQEYKNKAEAEKQATDEATRTYDDLVAALILIALSEKSKGEKYQLINKYEAKIRDFNADFARRHVENAYEKFSKEAIKDIQKFEKITGTKLKTLDSTQKAEMKNLVDQMENRLNRRLGTLIEDAKRLVLKEDLKKIREKKMGVKKSVDNTQITPKKSKPDLVFTNSQGKVVKMKAVMKVTVGDQIWQTIFDAKRATYLKLGYRYVRHISVIDSVTTPLCRSLHRKIRDLLKDKIPPLHYGCRSVIELLPKTFKP